MTGEETSCIISLVDDDFVTYYILIPPSPSIQSGDSSIMAAKVDIPHGTLIVMDTLASGSKSKSVYHTAGNCPYSFIFGADVRPWDSRGVETLSQVGGTPDFIPANDRSREFVQNTLQDHVLVLHTEMFDDWYTEGGIYDQLKERIVNKRLAPINYEGRDSHSSGTNMDHTIEVLSEIREFKQYIDQLRKYFSIRSFWILVHGKYGKHEWHPDSFVSGATHRCILSLGCQNKVMGFAHRSDVKKDALAAFL